MTLGLSNQAFFFFSLPAATFVEMPATVQKVHVKLEKKKEKQKKSGCRQLSPHVVVKLPFLKYRHFHEVPKHLKDLALHSVDDFHVCVLPKLGSVFLDGPVKELE